MSIIDNYFISQAPKLSYLELKNNEEIYLDYGLNDIPLPIITDDLMHGLQNEKFTNEINIDYIVDGILFNLAVDKDFKYISDYKNIINNLVKEPSKLAIDKGIKAMDTDLERALIFFKAAHELDGKNSFAAYNYARLLWRLDLNKEEKSTFIGEAIKILEKVTIDDPSFALAFFELANINKSIGEYMKSMNLYKKTLALVEEENLKEEIRTKMKEIEPDALVEDAIYFINKMDYGKAIDLLNDANKLVSRYDVLYYLAVCYTNLDQLDLADEFFQKAIDGGADFATLYIDYIFVKYSKHQTEQALDLANQAIDRYPADIKLRYNRGLILAELGAKSKAIEDLDFILEYADLSDEMFNQVMIAKEGIINS